MPCGDLIGSHNELYSSPEDFIVTHLKSPRDRAQSDHLVVQRYSDTMILGNLIDHHMQRTVSICDEVYNFGSLRLS